MPIYCLVCPACQARSQRFAAMAARDGLACDACKHPRLETDYAIQGAAKPSTRMREFHGDQRISRTHVWHKGDVVSARQRLGGAAAACIQDNGDVVFNNRAEEQTYLRAISAKS